MSIEITLKDCDMIVTYKPHGLIRVYEGEDTIALDKEQAEFLYQALSTVFRVTK